MILSVMYTGGSTLVSTVLRKSVRFFIINYFSIIIKTLSKLKFREFFGPALLQMLYNMDIEMSSLRKHPFLLALRRWGRFAQRRTSKEIAPQNARIF